MANPKLIDIAMRLAAELGANTSKFLGTRSNVSFLGSGPKDGMLFQKNINPEMISVIGQEKLIPAIEASMSYASGGKLNDLQINKLIDNMTVMKETLNPTNILKGDFGLDSLRAKSGIGERQLTESEALKRFPEESREFMGRPLKDEDFAKIDQLVAEGKIPPAGDIKSIDGAAPYEELTTGQVGGLMSKLENRIGGMRNETEAASAIMETIPKVDLPGKRASSREFLVNALKVGDDSPSTTFRDTISAEDLKFITEGGGGVEADPIVLIQKYFGPRVAEMMPVGATTEEMAILTKRILDNVTDAKGLRPDHPEFDSMTAKLVEETFAEGGRAGFQGGGRTRFFEGALADTAEGKAMSPGTSASGGTHAGGYGRDDVPLGNNTGDGTGITSVVEAPPELSTLDKIKNWWSGPKEEEEKEDDEEANKKTSAMDLVDVISTENSPYKKAATSVAAHKQAILDQAKALGYAEGGIARLGLRFGGSSKILKRISNKMIKKAADDIYPTGDYKYDAEMVVDSLVENNPRIFKNMLADDLDDALRSDLYGLALAETGNRFGMQIKARRAGNVPLTETTTPPRQFQLNVEKAVSELNIPREEAMRIAQLPSDQQKLALQKYMDMNMAQKAELMNYSPKTFDAAHGGLAKILEV